MKKLKSISYLLLTTPLVTFAADKTITENNDNSLVAFLVRTQNWLLGIVGALTILFIVYGGFLYITSGGNQQKTDKAKKTLTYAILGLIIVVLSGLILKIITGDFLPSIFGNNTLSY